MWLELTDRLGKRTLVNKSLVLAMKEGLEGHTILEVGVMASPNPHRIEVRESVEAILALMEGRAGGAPGRGPNEAESDFVSDGNEG